MTFTIRAGRLTCDHCQQQAPRGDIAARRWKQEHECEGEK